MLINRRIEIYRGVGDLVADLGRISGLMVVGLGFGRS